VDHALHTIPALVRRSLEAHLHAHHGAFASPRAVSNLLSNAITTFDDTLTNDFKSLFSPGDIAALRRMDDGQIRRLFQSSQNRLIATRCLHGSTALLSLTDPSRQHLWICNLGDSQAGESFSCIRPCLPSIHSPFSRSVLLCIVYLTIQVLASRSHTGGNDNKYGSWKPIYTSTLHDGDNTSELRRLRDEHHNERDVCKDNRVIGFLGPTRCASLSLSAKLFVEY
jgi:pyruvate dehydrogenase phosphatase